MFNRVALLPTCLVKGSKWHTMA